MFLGFNKDLYILKEMLKPLGLNKKLSITNILEVQISQGEATFTKRWSFNEKFKTKPKRVYKKSETIKNKLQSCRRQSSLGSLIIQNKDRSPSLIVQPNNINEARTSIKKYSNNTALKKIDLVSKNDILRADKEWHEDHKYTKFCWHDNFGECGH